MSSPMYRIVVSALFHGTASSRADAGATSGAQKHGKEILSFCNEKLRNPAASLREGAQHAASRIPYSRPPR